VAAEEERREREGEIRGDGKGMCEAMRGHGGRRANAGDNQGRQREGQNELSGMLGDEVKMLAKKG
jgi:hypothetical protein